MKKIILSLFLLLAFTDAETPIKKDSEIGKWRSFVGVEGGVGMMQISSLFIVGFSPSLMGLKDFKQFDLSYGVGILGGWQKYTYEKVGMRNTLGLRVFVAPKISKGFYSIFTDVNQLTTPTTDFSLYYALDGLFDFIKNGENRFGMSLGFSTDILSVTFGKETFGIGWVLKFAPRIGVYVQFDSSMIDCTFSFPLTSAGLFDIAYNSTLTLGYKYLF